MITDEQLQEYIKQGQEQQPRRERPPAPEPGATPNRHERRKAAALDRTESRKGR